MSEMRQLSIKVTDTTFDEEEWASKARLTEIQERKQHEVKRQREVEAKHKVEEAECECVAKEAEHEHQAEESWSAEDVRMAKEKADKGPRRRQHGSMCSRPW
jgi:hypothetical protein